MINTAARWIPATRGTNQGDRKRRVGPALRAEGTSGSIDLHGISGVISRGEKMALRDTDPESYITQYSLIYEDN